MDSSLTLTVYRVAAEKHFWWTFRKFSKLSPSAQFFFLSAAWKKWASGREKGKMLHHASLFSTFESRVSRVARLALIFLRQMVLWGLNWVYFERIKLKWGPQRTRCTIFPQCCQLCFFPCLSFSLNENCRQPVKTENVFGKPRKLRVLPFPFSGELFCVNRKKTFLS